MMEGTTSMTPLIDAPPEGLIVNYERAERHRGGMNPYIACEHCLKLVPNRVMLVRVGDGDRILQERRLALPVGMLTERQRRDINTLLPGWVARNYEWYDGSEVAMTSDHPGCCSVTCYEARRAAKKERKAR